MVLEPENCSVLNESLYSLNPFLPYYHALKLIKTQLGPEKSINRLFLIIMSIKMEFYYIYFANEFYARCVLQILLYIEMCQNSAILYLIYEITFLEYNLLRM